MLKFAVSLPSMKILANSDFGNLQNSKIRKFGRFSRVAATIYLFTLSSGVPLCVFFTNLHKPSFPSGVFLTVFVQVCLFAFFYCIDFLFVFDVVFKCVEGFLSSTFERS